MCTNTRENKSGLIQVILYTASKRIKLESPGCSGFKANLNIGKFASRPDQPGLNSYIRLEFVYI